MLGIMFNTIDMTISVAPEWVSKIQAELNAWCNRATISLKQLESLIGKLKFASQVIRVGCVFLAHLLDELWGSPKWGYMPVPASFLQDLRWWQYVMPILNGSKSIYLDIFFEPGALIDTDATLVGAGEVCKGHYFHTPFPQFNTQQAHIIAHLELLAFIAALKAWPHLICNTKFVVRLDNMMAILAINTGCSKDTFINADLWEITFLLAMHNFEVRAHHIPGVTNIIPGLLSHWDLGDAACQQFNVLNQDNHLTRTPIDAQWFQFIHQW